MKGLLNKIKLNARAAKIVAGSAVGVSAVAAVGASASTAESLVTNLLGYVFGMFRYIGILLLAWGVGQLILAFKNEDADSKSRAMMLIVVAIVLTVISSIFNGLNLVSGNVSANNF